MEKQIYEATYGLQLSKNLNQFVLFLADIVDEDYIRLSASFLLIMDKCATPIGCKNVFSHV